MSEFIEFAELCYRRRACDYLHIIYRFSRSLDFGVWKQGPESRKGREKDPEPGLGGGRV